MRAVCPSTTRPPAVAAALAFAACALTSCALTSSTGARRPPDVASPPALVVGTFEDDYGHRFTVTEGAWRQHPSPALRIAAWHAGERWLVAENPAGGPDAGRWTRIDWVALDPSMAPYAWAFCLSAYDAPTRAAAESTRVARPETPRTGCNGSPFSRMKRVAP